jgi:hypothetical protein
MIDDDEPAFPVLGYTLAVVVRFEYATTRAEYSSREGETEQYVMTPANAAEIGRALVETGELAQRQPS